MQDGPHNSMKKKNKHSIAPMKNLSPLKLDKNLKSIENRILQKMKSKRDANGAHHKMPSIDKSHSPAISYGNLELIQIKLFLVLALMRNNRLF